MPVRRASSWAWNSRLDVVTRSRTDDPPAVLAPVGPRMLYALDTLVQDVRYGLRLIRKAPGFTAVAIASLAFGIGASTVLFSFANSFVLRPIAAAHPDYVGVLLGVDREPARA